MELNGAGVVTNKFVRGINLIYSEDGAGANRRYYLFNAHGDTVQLTDTSGNVVKSYDYDAFGNEKTIDPNDANPFRYCGGEYYWDNETGDYYIKARYYDPTIGRFISEDSSWSSKIKLANGTEIDDPLSLNLYNYCANNPVMYFDSDGHCFMLITGGIGAVVGGIAGGIYSYAKYGEVKWQYVAGGAVAGGVIGLTGGAGAAYLTTGSVFASTGAVLGGAASSWAAAATAITATTNSATKGRIFEKWFYGFNNISTKMQQVVVNGVGRLDSVKNGVIYELKNYDWSKYSSYNSIITDFTSQATKYQSLIGQVVNGDKIKQVVYYFSNKPPQTVIDALKNIGVKVDWVK